VTTHLDTTPLERDDVHETFMDVLVLVDEVESEVEGESRGVKDVG
jgi:hypothetical protein